MPTLTNIINHLEQNIPNHAHAVAHISKVNVGWHIAHSLITISTIIDLLAKSTPDRYKKRLNLAWIAARSLRWFPRGTGKAPKIARPDTEVTAESLQTLLTETRQKLTQFDALHQQQYFRHPYFGMLNVSQAKKFLLVHTRHHLKIIRDIRQAVTTNAKTPADHSENSA